MPRPALTARWILRTYRIAALPWLAHALAFGTLLWASNYFRGSDITLLDSIALAVPGSALWLLATPFVIAFTRRIRLKRANFLAGLGKLIAFGAALHVGFALILHAEFIARVGPRWNVNLFAFLADWSVTDLVRFGVVVACTKAYDNHRSTRSARRKALRLRSDLAEAELELLHLRLQPHFLFNALQAMSELVHVDPARADRAIVAMGELLRRGLASSGRPIVPLAEELLALDAYVDLERIRRTQRLDVRIDVPDHALALGVPNFSLQPIVENSLRHGLSGREHGTIRLSARSEGGRLEITIEDDGVGPPQVPGSTGRGLSNVRQRLARLYGDDAGLALEPGIRGGALARLWLPARPIATPTEPWESACEA